MTRERYLSLIAAEPFHAKWEHGAMRVRVSEGMAAIRYQAKITFPSGKVVDCWHTDIYALQAGRWKAVWSQATPFWRKTRTMPSGSGVVPEEELEDAWRRVGRRRRIPWLEAGRVEDDAHLDLRKEAARIQLAPFGRLTAVQKQAIAVAAEKYAAFHGVRAEIA